MAVVIDLCSQASSGNTRAISCDPRRANAKSIIIGGAEFTPDQFGTSATFKAAFLAATKLGSLSSGKLFPFPEVKSVNVSTEANKEFTFGNGTKVTISEGRPSYGFDLYIGVNLEKQLRKFNSQTVPVFIFDDAGNVWGKKNAAGNFVGIKANIFVSGAGFGDYNNPSFAKLSVNFESAADFFDYSAFVPTDFNVNDIEGLFDATLTELSHAAGVRKIKAEVINAQLGGNKDLYAEYDDLLASASLWKATNVETGANIPITTVAKDDALEAWTVTLDATAYGAVTTGGKIKIQLADPTVLDSADVTDIESVPLLVTK